MKMMRSFVSRNAVRRFTARPSVSRNVRQYKTMQAASRMTYSKPMMASGTVFGAAVLAWYAADNAHADDASVDWDALEDDLRRLINSAGNYDDGSYGPLFIRLAWHAAGSYSKYTKTGGSTGASMRFKDEASHGGNAGLHVARELLEPIKAKYPGASYADIWSLAGTVAIEELGGPRASWKAGRTDYASEDSFTPTPDGRLPDAAQGADHLRDIFYRMGFSDREIVALSGAHVLGRCHKDRSGFDGPWSNNPTFFSNDYFRLLLDETWTPRKWNGPFQYEDSSKKLMMLPSDIALIQDPAFSHWVNVYANDEEQFFKDFAKAWTKLQELGVDFGSKSVWEKLFG